MLSLSWQLHLAVRVITLEKYHGQAETGSHTEDTQALNGKGIDPGANNVLKIWDAPFMLGPGAGKP